MTQRVKAKKNNNEAIVVYDDRFADLRLPTATSSGQVAVDVATLREAGWILKR